MVGASICEAFGEYTHAKKQVVMEKYQLFNGNNIDKLRELEDNSVDAVVTDPPYGLSFMSKKWDYDVPSIELWQEVYRVLKPGGHVLSFGGTRTYHRMVVNMEDAGFEIRDQIQWLYGSGFPKSHNIGKAIDKMQGNEREVVGDNPNNRPNSMKGADTNAPSGYKVYQYNKITKGQSEWEGWGTALKPANEPICLARKPLVGTVAENVLQYGTGGLNIDESRIATDELTPRNNKPGPNGWKNSSGGYIEPSPLGRWPANVIHDGSDEVVRLFPQTTSGVFKGPTARLRHGHKLNPNGNTGTSNAPDQYGDSGSAARFFYSAKVSKSERNAGCEGMQERESASTSNGGKAGKVMTVGAASLRGEPKAPPKSRNHHPTVKPIDLMRYLCKLITPPGGIVLDPFMGSGSTGCAAILDGFKFIGIELDEEYFKIAEARITHFNPSDFW